MKLAVLCERFDALPFPCAAEYEHPERDTVARLRSLVRDALADDEFLIDCIAHELRHLSADLRARRSRPNLGVLSPFFTLPGFGVRFAFGYWRPGRAAPPHEHTAWTVTAVCRNELDVTTFDRTESYRQGRLVEKSRFQAEAGQVGFIYEPAIHAPRNTSGTWTLSLHVSSPRDGLPIAGVEPLSELAWPSATDANSDLIDHVSTRAFGLSDRYRELAVLARVLLSTPRGQALGALSMCFEMASSATRRMIARAAPERFAVSASPRLLARLDDKLRLVVDREPQGCALYVETPTGPRRLFSANDLAHDALAFAVTRSCFEVGALPGPLSEDEQTALGDMLEATGTFQRIEP